MRDAVYALDAIYGVDPRDNYTLAQEGKTPADGYTQFLSNKDALKDATFGIPWQSFWVYAPPEQQTALLGIIADLEAAGATIVNGTELKEYETIVSPNGWNWYDSPLFGERWYSILLIGRNRDYGTTRGYPNESEFTVVKVGSNCMLLHPSN